MNIMVLIIIQQSTICYQVDWKRTMNQIVSKYSKLLMKLSKLSITNQFKYLALSKPVPFNRQKYINVLLTAKPELIQRRIHFHQKQRFIVPQNKNNIPLVVVEEFRKKQLSQIQQHLQEIKKQIYFDLQDNYNKITGNTQKYINKYQKGSSKNLSLSELYAQKYDDIYMPPLNLLMNAQQELLLHPNKIKYQYQHSIIELLSVHFPSENAKDLEAKAKKYAKNILPAHFKYDYLKGDTESKLLLLYGLKKEQQFQQDLQDPLQQLLSKTKMNKQIKLAKTIKFVNKLNQRKPYYLAIIKSLKIDKLKYFIETIKQIQNVSNLNQINRYQVFISLIQFILQNQNYKRLINSSIISQILHNQHQVVLNNQKIDHILYIETFIFEILKKFCNYFQNENFKRQEILRVSQLINHYKIAKPQQQKRIIQIINKINGQNSDNKSVQSSLQLRKQYAKSLNTLLQQEQSQGLYQKILQIIIFLDLKQSVSLAEQTIIYKNLLDYLLQFYEVTLPNHIVQKIVNDHINIFHHCYDVIPNNSQIISESYLDVIIQFVFKNANKQIQDLQILKIVPYLWRRYCQIHEKLYSLDFQQGKYFIMMIYSCAIYDRRQSQINKILAKDKLIVQMVRRYTKMLKDNRRQSKDLIKNVQQMFEEYILPLFRENQLNSQLTRLINQIKLLNDI